MKGVQCNELFRGITLKKRIFYNHLGFLLYTNNNNNNASEITPTSIHAFTHASISDVWIYTVVS